MKSYRQFFAELKRRQVFKVAAVYGAVGFVVLQLADILVPALALPDAFTRGIALLLVLAFPIALVLAWALERLRLEGRPEEALAMLEGQSRHMWYAQTAVSPLFTQVRERFVQAELLRELGRLAEARRWYRTIDQLSLFDVPYRSVAEERLAELGPGAGG